MARRKQPKSELRSIYVKATAASVSVHRSCAKIFVYERDEAAWSSITIKGKLDVPVVRMENTCITVFRRDSVAENPGRALGISPEWQVVVHLPDPQFSELFTVVALGGLKRAHLLMESVKRGSGAVRSISFYTDEEEDE